ncbi:hypothetical protein YPPY03_0303 [Yersinia pestis PY-03]|nr:hypothetical protein YPPY03_0303 [Yersinia pestis PY-03]
MFRITVVKLSFSRMPTAICHIELFGKLNTVFVHATIGNEQQIEA